MKRKYETIEDLRKARREAQARWRAKAGGAERLKARNAYWSGRIPLIAGMVVEYLEQRGLVVSSVDLGKEEVRPRVVVGETRVEPVEGFDTATREYEGRQGVYKRREESGAVIAAVGPPKPVRFNPGYEGAARIVPPGRDEHAMAVARLEELKGRQARGELNKGVEVELEI